jgi:hypothetical protein
MSVAPLQPVTPPSWKTVLPLSPTSNTLLYEVHAGYEISDTIMRLCAQLFSENYGIWGHHPPGIKGPKPGLSSLTSTFLQH